MRVVSNTELIKQRTKWTQRGSLLGMGLLLVSLFLTWREQPLIAWAFLIAGFFVAMASARIGNRYVRPPRRDLLLDKLLKGLDNRYTLYHYFAAAEHLLLTPSGLIAIRMQEQGGRVAVHGNRWRQRSTGHRLRFLLGEESLGNPARELRRDIERTRRALAQIEGLPPDVPFDGAIVFYHNKVQLEVQDPEFPTVRTEDLRATLRAQAEAHPALSTSARKALGAALAGDAEPVEVAPEPEPARKAGKKTRRAGR